MSESIFEPVLMQKGCLLRATINPDGGVRVSLNEKGLHEADPKDLIFLLGSIRQMEHRILSIFNGQDN